MIVLVLGFSKSGTTLVSKTLHESGINMHPGKTGNYNQSKYEDPEAIKILLQMLRVDRLKSLYIPDKIFFNAGIKKQIRTLINNRSGDWGIKQPYLTLCYQEWQSLLPPHICVGIRRNFEGVKSHWTKRGKKIDEKKLYRVWKLYNTYMEMDKIPMISFEYFINHGPGQLQRVIGRKLKDVRE